MGCGGGGGGAISQQEQQRQDKIKLGTKQIDSVFSAFNPAFYQKYGQAYQNYALPQLQEQYQNVSNRLGYRLAGQGLGQSSVARNLRQSLSDEMTTQQQNVANQAMQQERDLQSKLANQQSNIVSQLQMSADPNAAAQQALATASQAQASPVFAPLGQAFNSWANIYLAQNQNQMYNQFAQSYLNNLMGFGGNAGALPKI